MKKDEKTEGQEQPSVGSPLKSKLSAWLTREIKSPIKLPRTPSIWERRLFKAARYLVLLLVFCFIVWRINLYFEINRRFDAIRAAKLPTSGQELNEWRHPVPDEENAALVLTQAIALLHKFPSKAADEIPESKLLDPGRQWTTSTRQSVVEYVVTNAPAVQMAQEALRRQRCRFDADFSCGPSTELPHLDGLKQLARIVALRAMIEAGEERTNAWLEDIGMELRLAATLVEEPVLISCLVHDSILRMTVQSAERGLNLFSPDAPTCEKLEAMFAAAGNTNLLPTALIGERALLIPVFRMSWREMQHLNQTDEDGASVKRKPQRFSGKPMTFLWLTGGFERDLNFFLQAMETNIACAALPPPASLVFTNVSEQLTDVARRRYYLLSSLLLPSYANVIVRHATTDANVRLARTALAVERFRLASGILPENLNELVPQFLSAVPMDPFDGQPLRYHRLTNGYVVYSVGRDCYDNGGRQKPADWKSSDKTNYDITFTVER
jgi:hypothetical protein